ncbi:polysaccharide pyruvyl transferase family protein, partial [Shewanella sp. SG44-6]|uniref:polysaccharide pyruvyl transferase family protein n=1 Tax=Shewanella sp. SG44-6 TaxID=2760959 RepID=UPI0016027190
MRKKNIVIEGAYGESNFGDDALLKVIYRELKDFLELKNYEVTICSKMTSLKYPVVDLCDEKVVTPKNNIDWTKVDSVIYGGGTQFYSFENEKSKLSIIKHYLTNPKELYSRLTRRQNESELEKHFVGVGIGPFEGKNKIEDFEYVLSDNKSLFVRDLVSYSYAEKLKLNNVKLYTDICFLENYSHLHRTRKFTKKVAIILRDWNHNSNNVRPQDLEHVVSQLLEKNIEVEYVLFGHDIQLEQELKARDLDYISYDLNLSSFDDFIKNLASYDLIVTSRYHGLIYGLLLGIPSIVINIEPKLS